MLCLPSFLRILHNSPSGYQLARGAVTTLPYAPSIALVIHYPIACRTKFPRCLVMRAYTLFTICFIDTHPINPHLSYSFTSIFQFSPIQEYASPIISLHNPSQLVSHLYRLPLHTLAILDSLLTTPIHTQPLALAKHRMSTYVPKKTQRTCRNRRGRRHRSAGLGSSAGQTVVVVTVELRFRTVCELDKHN